MHLLRRCISPSSFKNQNTNRETERISAISQMHKQRRVNDANCTFPPRLSPPHHPCWAASSSLGTPRVDLIAGRTRAGSSDPTFREPATQYSLQIEHLPRKQSRSRKGPGGEEDQKENKLTWLLIQVQRKPTGSGDTLWLNLSRAATAVGFSPTYNEYRHLPGSRVPTERKITPGPGLDTPRGTKPLR